MFSRLPIIVSSVALALGLAFPAYASSHLVAQRTTTKGSNFLFLATALQAGHRYQIQLSAKGHYKFSGYGNETLTYILSHHLGTTNKSLPFSGSTPKTFLVTQPAQQGVSTWSLVISITTKTTQPVKMRLVDLGK